VAIQFHIGELTVYNNELSSLFIELGLTEPATIILNGTIQRLPLSGKPKTNKDGWYIGWETYSNGKDFVFCRVGNWALGETIDYKSWESNSYLLTDTERAEIEQHQKQIAEQQRKELEKRHKQAAEDGRSEWREASSDGNSDYLTKKQIKPHSIKFSNDCIIIPVTSIGNHIVGLQRIFNNGDKRFLTGTPTKGNFQLIGNSPIDGDKILFSESYSTSSSIHEATGLTVINCFSANNLLPVIQSWREKYPFSHFVICADNDQFKETNTGIDAAKNVIANVRGCSMVYPIFDGLNIESKPTDFNDLHCLAGLDAVKNTIETAMEEIEPPEPEEIEAMFFEQDSKTDKDLPQWKIELNERIEKLNQNYAVVLDGSKALVMKTVIDTDGRNERLFLSTEAFTKLHMNKILMVGINSRYGTPIYKNEASAWLEHWNRKEYTDGIVFEPSQYPNGIEKRATIHGKRLNLWQGYSIEPAQQDGALERIYSHIQDVICSGDNDCNEYLLNWVARCFQYPNLNGQVAVALKGEKGCGKSTLGKFIKSIFGQHALQITNPKHLIGSFNAHMEDCCFLFADEAFFAGDKAHENIQKGLITEPTFMIERKGVDAIERKNRIKILMASNNDWIAPASKDERRYFVLDVSSEKIGDTKYFNALHRDIDNADIQAAFLYEMLHRDISNFNVGKIPDTKALQHQREQSLDSFGKYWIDVLQRGYIYQSQHGLGALNEWIAEPAVELIKRGYVQWCNTNKIDQHRIVSTKKYGGYLTSWYGDKKRKSNCFGFLCGETVKGEIDTSKGQTYLYAVGTQREAIEAFCKIEKLDAEKLI
jgi:phage/plasmid primase-like uncharacterized protein